MTTEVLAKLFARGNRVSDRLYADRARPTLNVRQLEREKKQPASADAKEVKTSTK